MPVASQPEDLSTSPRVASFRGNDSKVESARPRQEVPFFRLGLLTLSAVAVHGYHLGADDAAVYLPAMVKAVRPELYPYGVEFFASHTHLSAFTTIVAASARLTRVDLSWVIFFWHLATIYAFLLALWWLACVCFDSTRARWSAELLVAALLTIPAGGSALVLMDPYLTARSASTPLCLMAITSAAARKPLWAGLWLAVAMLIHPLMVGFAAMCVLMLALPDDWTIRLFRLPTVSRLAIALPLGLSFRPIGAEYRAALEMRPFLFLTRWTWYELVGVFAPLAFFFYLNRWPPRVLSATSLRICRALMLLGILATAVAWIFASSESALGLLCLQPMRVLHLVYTVFFLLLGGLAGAYASRKQYGLLLAFLVAIAGGMFMVQQSEYSHSSHVEWPGTRAGNAWVGAFLWVRDHTPKNAVFALDPQYMLLPGEDQHGFRGLAERSALSDYVKDSGVVSLFPQLAPAWAGEQRAQQDWQSFHLAEFQQIAREYPVSWVILQGGASRGLDCPYRNEAVTVCKIPGARGIKEAGVWRR